MDDAKAVLNGADPRAVSTLLDVGAAHRHEWRPEELAEMLRHQLAAPLHLSLGVLSAEAAHAIRQSKPALDPLVTMGQLLEHPQPPVELLKLVKRFAKMCMKDRHNPLPTEIVMLLYYAAIAAALLRTGERITDLPAASLRRGLRWISIQGWVNEPMGTLLRQAIARLDAGGADTSGSSKSAAGAG